MKPDFSLIPEPDRTTIARKPLTQKQRAELALFQGGRCGCGCGVKLDHAGEGTIDEHMNPLALTGTNDLENRKLFRLPCAKAKTVTDKGFIAKAKRNEARETRTRRQRKAIPSPVNPWPAKGSRKLQTKRSLRSVADSLPDNPAGYEDASSGVGMNQETLRTNR